MDVYPLEKLREGIKGYSKYLRKQHEEMLILLEDPCPIVRVIAIKVINEQQFPIVNLKQI